DALTHEIVERRAPVLIRDAITDPRGGLSALRAWKVRAILGVPILHGERVIGLLYLDNAGALHPYTDAQVEAAAAVGGLAGAALARCEADARLRAERDAAVRQCRLLRRAALADSRFGQVVLGGGGVGGIVGALAELTA